MNIPLFIQKNIPLNDKNWFKVGGPAEFFAEIKNNENLHEAIEFAKMYSLQITILGSGANVLISDEGIRGLVIHINMQDIVILEKTDEYAYVEVGAGLRIEDLINWGIDNQLLGLEEFSGIPSSVGGALYINLHYFKFLIQDFLMNATIFNIETNKIEKVTTEWFEYKYDYSKIFEKKYIILSGIFKLKISTELESMYAMGRSHEIIRHRKQRYPYEYTCGSFFQNFAENEVSLVSDTGKKIIFAAYYLDQVGVKGVLKIGGAMVSHKHANMIVSSSNAKALDIIEVAKTMQEKVLNQFDILLRPECELLGFDKYPLHKKNIL
jgi:UDP-N-acetylmuramate dehydrogenase